MLTLEKEVMNLNKGYAEFQGAGCKSLTEAVWGEFLLSKCRLKAVGGEKADMNAIDRNGFCFPQRDEGDNNEMLVGLAEFHGH